MNEEERIFLETFKDNDEMMQRFGYYKGCTSTINNIKTELNGLTDNKEKFNRLLEIREDLLFRDAEMELLGFDYFQNLGFEDLVIKYINSEIEHLEKLEKLGTGAEVPKLPKPGKIKWTGTPSQFGYLFTELVKNGFIEPPLYRGDPNYTGLAKLCFQYFNIYNKEGELTTLENLIKEMNPSKNTLSETKRAKFTIPNISDLA